MSSALFPMRSVVQPGTRTTPQTSAYDAILGDIGHKHRRVINDPIPSEDIQHHKDTIVFSPAYISIDDNHTSTQPFAEEQLWLRHADGTCLTTKHVVKGVIPTDPSHHRFILNMTNYLFEMPLGTDENFREILKGHAVIRFPTSVGNNTYGCYQSRSPYFRVGYPGDDEDTPGRLPKDSVPITLGSDSQLIRPFNGSNDDPATTDGVPFDLLQALPIGIPLPVQPGSAMNGIKNWISLEVKASSQEVVSIPSDTIEDDHTLASHGSTLAISDKRTIMGIPWEVTYSLPVYRKVDGAVYYLTAERAGKMFLSYDLIPMDHSKSF